ncbi:MAG: hypothetical protein IJV34_03985 [Prevotella sp.]|nr:hypothetical protein [Prevotella sp.]
MKRFLIRIAITAVLTGVMVVIASTVMLLRKDQLSYYSHERNVALAYDRLQALKDTNKIVIIAGSSAGFSINSRMIEQAFHMPVVNTGTHGGIGTRMQFELYSDLLREGDIVIFCPEYGTKKKTLYGEATLLRILSTHMPEAYSKFSLAQWLFQFKNIGIHCREAHEHRKAEAFDGPYSEKALNEYGDIEWERPHQDTISYYGMSSEMDEDLLAFYQYIHSNTQERGIHLLFLPPTFMKGNFQQNAEHISWLANCLKQNGIPWQAEPSAYAFDDSLFYDTPYHMTPEGTVKRTEVLISDLQKYLRSLNTTDKHE